MQGIADGNSAFTGISVLPSIASIALTSYSAKTRRGVFRVSFSTDMTLSGISLTTDYAVTTLNGGAKAVVHSVTPESGTSTPTYVDVTVRGMTPGKAYRLTVANA
jgi:hypothetical protein